MIIVEVLGRSGHVAHRARLDGSASIGRAYDNDVIIDDPFVDPHALAISVSEGGAILVRDLGTMNGAFGTDGKPLAEATAVRAGDVLRVGRTRLRVMRSNTPVPPTLGDTQGRLSAFATSRFGLPIAVLAFLVGWSITSYSNEVEDFTAAVLLTELVVFLLFFAIWAGAWALGGRLSRGRARFREHATIAVGLVTAWMPVGLVFGLVAFLWPGDFTDFMGLASGIAIATLILYGHLGVSLRMRRRARGIVAASIVLSLVGIGYLAGTIDPEPELPVQSALGSFLPVPARLIPAENLDGFMEEATADLEAELEDQAAR